MSRRAPQKGTRSQDKQPEPKPQEHIGSPSPRPSISWAEAVEVHGSPSPDQQSAVPEDRTSPQFEQMQRLMMQMLQRNHFPATVLSEDVSGSIKLFP
jgi:hypothetical protein